MIFCGWFCMYGSVMFPKGRAGETLTKIMQSGNHLMKKSKRSTYVRGTAD